MNENIAATFLIVFREALEAGLIVGIIFTVLNRLKAMRYASHVIVSVAAAILCSFMIAWVFNNATENASETANQIIETLVSFIACGVLTYMVFWMEKQARNIKSEIENRLQNAISNSELAVIISLPFLAVLREGFETVLFLKAIALKTSQAVSWIGGLSGFGLAAVISCLIFVFGKRVPLKPFFKFTGFFLILIAGGLLAYGVHEANELGWIPSGIEHVWNINHILNEKEGIGSFLKALFGYNGNPSLTEVLAYLIYMSTIGWMLKKSS